MWPFTKTENNADKNDQSKARLLEDDGNNDDFPDDESSPHEIKRMKELFSLILSTGLCYTILLLLYYEFLPILIGVVLFDNILSIIQMVLSVIYMNDCPVETHLSPTLFAFAFIALVKSAISIWTNRSIFQNKIEPEENVTTFCGKNIKLIIFNGLQLMTLGFFAYGCYLIFLMYPIVELEATATTSSSSLTALDNNSIPIGATVSSSMSQQQLPEHYCNKIFFAYSFLYMALNIMYTFVFIVWTPCILFCVLK